MYEDRDTSRARLDRMTTAPKAPEIRRTPIAHVSQTLERSAALTERVVQLATRLVGNWPQEEADGKPIPAPPSGVFGNLDMACNDLDDKIGAANDALSAIERDLP